MYNILICDDDADIRAALRCIWRRRAMASLKQPTARRRWRFWPGRPSTWS